MVNKMVLKIPKGYSEVANQKRTDNTIAKRKRAKGKTMLYTTQHKNYRLSNRSLTKSQGVILGAPEGLAVPVSLVAPVVLLINDTNII